MKRTPESLGLLGGLLVVFFLGTRFLGSPMPVWTLSLGVLGVFLLSAYLLLDRPALQKRQPHVVSALASSVFWWPWVAWWSCCSMFGWDAKRQMGMLPYRANTR